MKIVSLRWDDAAFSSYLFTRSCSETVIRRYFFAMFILSLASGGCRPHHDTTREEHVAARGASVMPFDLDRTTHVFEKMRSGGRQQVISDDGDSTQVALIRSHLAEEAVRFSRGDFGDPKSIHGEHMPGLQALAGGYDRIDIAYSAIPNGGQILYTANDPKLISALHAWFDAQLADHGAHAQDHP